MRQCIETRALEDTSQDKNSIGKPIYKKKALITGSQPYQTILKEEPHTNSGGGEIV